VSNGRLTPQIGSDQALLRYLAVQPMHQSLYFGAAQSYAAMQEKICNKLTPGGSFPSPATIRTVSAAHWPNSKPN
jgi:hypothetical protein